VVLPNTTHNIGDMLSTIHANEKADSRKMLLKIVYFLGRQGIALRGHNYSESNFMQVLTMIPKVISCELHSTPYFTVMADKCTDLLIPINLFCALAGWTISWMFMRNSWDYTM